MEEQNQLEKNLQQKNINNINNANNVRVAANAAKNSANPWAKAIGTGINVADKMSGGKASEKLGKSLTTANKMAGLKGRLAQKALNKMSENGTSNRLSSVLSAKENKAPIAPGTKSNLDTSNNVDTTLSKETLESGDGETKTFEIPKIVKTGIILMIPTFIIIMFVALLTTSSSVYIKSVGLGHADSVSSDDAEKKINKKKNQDKLIDEGITDNDLSFNSEISNLTFASNKLKEVNLVQTKLTKFLKRKKSVVSLDELEDFYPSISNLKKEYSENLVYDFFFKMYNIFTAYRDNYGVYLDLPLLMSTLYLESDDMNVIFNSNLSDLDKSEYAREKPIDEFDYYYDWSNYISTPDSSVHDMEILAQHMVSKVPYDSSSKNCENPKDGYCFVVDEDKYEEFLKEFIEKKYYLENYSFGENKENHNKKEEQKENSKEEENKEKENKKEEQNKENQDKKEEQNKEIDKSDWRNWKQCDSSWKNVKIGKKGGTVCSIGCAVTSIAMQIARSGTLTTVPVNPGVAAQKFVFTDGGGIYWGDIHKLAPNFYYETDITLAGMSKSDVAKKLSSYDPKKYYFVIGVNRIGSSSSHYVALDYVASDGELYMFDPSTNNTKLYDIYKVKTALVYKKAD